jgi:LacI family transcriptional regulator
VLNSHSSISEKKPEKTVLNAVQTLGYYPNANAQGVGVTEQRYGWGWSFTDVTDSFFAILVKSVDQVCRCP